jgi:N-acetylneuraminic acid mutarotase
MRCASLILASLLLVACGDDGGDSGPDAGIQTDVRPSKRSDIAGVADSNTGTIAVFGGDDGPIVNQIPSPSYLGDTWVFDPAQGWSEVTGAGPSARGRHAVAYDPSGARMLSFGGRWRQSGTTGNYTLYGDLWAFDFNARTWTMVDDGSGTAPTPRYFATSAYDPMAAKLYVYGGDTNPSALTINPSPEVWSHDGQGWTQETVTGTAPSGRLFMAYTYDSSRNRLVIFGGQVGDFVTAAFNDLYALDLGTMTWSQLHDGNGTAPSGRFSALMVYDAERDRYLMTGGHADLGTANDVWAFNPTSNTWSSLQNGDQFTGGSLGCLGNPQEIPADYVTQDLASPERRSGGVFQILGSQAWLFGGESDCSDHLDDTWRFDLTSDSWTELIGARSGESCARRNDSCTCLCI